MIDQMLFDAVLNGQSTLTDDELGRFRLDSRLELGRPDVDLQRKTDVLEAVRRVERAYHGIVT